MKINVRGKRMRNDPAPGIISIDKQCCLSAKISSKIINPLSRFEQKRAQPCTIIIDKGLVGIENF